MTRPRRSHSQPTSLTESELIAFAALLDDWSERSEHGLSLEHVDGFLTALICSPRTISPDEYFPVLLGEAGLDLFDDVTVKKLFGAFFERRWQQVARALESPVESLNDPSALEPLIMDWHGLLSELSAAERDALLADGLPEFASVWAAGFLQVVDAWEADWALPPDSKDESFVDEMLEPFYILITPADELTAEERNTRREDYVAQAIWSVYELYDFWRDRGCTLSKPH